MVARGLATPVQTATPSVEIHYHPRIRGTEGPEEGSEGSPESDLRPEEGSLVESAEMEEPPPEVTWENLEEMPYQEEP